MKFLLLLAVVLGMIWLLRSLRKPTLPPQQGPTPGQVAEIEDMVRCAQCGVHLPRSEGYPGRGGVFCCEAHRSAFESRQD